MTNSLLSREGFLLFINQARAQSSLLRVSGHTGALEMDGRVSTLSADTFRIRGRGCELLVDFSESSFERFVARDGPLITMRPEDPEGLFRPLWRLEWPSEDTLLVAERSPSDPPVST